MYEFLRKCVDVWLAESAVVALILVALTAIELTLPRGRRNIVGRLQGLVFWGLWLPVTALVMTAFHSLWAAAGIRPAVLVDLSKWIERTGPVAPVLTVVIAAAVADFFFYWFHRAQHAFFWRFHAVHHAIEDMNAVNSYHHITESLFSVVLVSIPTSLLVVDAGHLLPMASILISAQVVFIHSPTKLNFGVLRFLLADNVYHRLHHGRERTYFDKNFAAATPLWDALFGTLRWPKNGEWPDVGLDEAPEPKSIREWLDLPLRIPTQTAPYTERG